MKAYSKIAIFALIALAVCLSLFIYFRSARNTAPPVIIASSLNKTDGELPIRLLIPKIKVDAAIEQVGITASGAMDAPRAPDNVGWFDLGPRPGQEGNAVIAGHSGWKDGRSASFDNLYQLAKGDKITVQNDKGKQVTFIVQRIQTYPAGAYVPDVFVSKSGKHLNLISCTGVWDKAAKTYTERVVAFADAVDQ